MYENSQELWDEKNQNTSGISTLMPNIQLTSLNHSNEDTTNISGIFSQQSRDASNIQTMSNNHSNEETNISGSFFQQSRDAFNVQPESNFGSIANRRGPLGLKLTITPAFCDMVSLALARAGPQNDHLIGMNGLPEPGNLRASKFDLSSLVIGNWEKISNRKDDLVGKCHYKRKKIVWEILEGDRKKKIEIKFEYIDAIKATIRDNETGILQIELNQPPEFAVETPPQPRKHTNWQVGSDFTNNQALLYRRHTVICPPGVLDKHYEQLLQSDSRLLELSRKPFSAQQNTIFPSLIDTINNSIASQFIVQQLPHSDQLSSNPLTPVTGYLPDDGSFTDGILNWNQNQENSSFDGPQELLEEHLIQGYQAPYYTYDSEAGIYDPNMVQIIPENTRHPLLDHSWGQTVEDNNVRTHSKLNISHLSTQVCDGDPSLNFSGENSINPGKRPWFGNEN